VVELYIDAEHGLPTRIANYDDKGLFESFDYTNYKFNVKLAPDYFTVDYLDSLN
jgi:outer membrane lipoprotein-sorting protein